MFRRSRRPRNRRERVESILRFRRATLSFVAIGCGASILGMMGSGAGAMWSLALELGPGVGALYGGLAAFGLGMIMIPLNNRIGTTLPLGCISVGLMLFLALLGTMFWIVGVAVR
ncbi:MAG: hypothetical protein JW753_07330 [Dehalococcoidia bacterium]|nr:hypothetical protein [Dehalococcoidia bacterium]